MKNKLCISFSGVEITKTIQSSQRITFSHTTWFGSHLETRGNNQETILSSQRIVKQRFREEKQIYESNFSKRKTIVSREKHSVFKTEATIFQDKKKNRRFPKQENDLQNTRTTTVIFIYE